MTKLIRGTVKRLHVHQDMIRQNIKNGTDEPVCLVQTSRGSHRGRSIKILDAQGNVVATLRQSIGKPLHCGARVWIETNAEVRVEE